MMQRVILITVFVLLNINANAGTLYKLGVISDKNSKEEMEAFNSIVNTLSPQTSPDVQIEYEHVHLEFTDSFAVSNAICELLEKGVYGVLGVSKGCALNTIQSYSDTFKIPFITLSMPQTISQSRDHYILYMRPLYIKGILDVIEHKKWRKLFYMYDTDEGLIRLQQLLQEINTEQIEVEIKVNRIVNADECYDKLLDLYNTEKDEIRLLMDLPYNETATVMQRLSDDIRVSNQRFHFFLSDLGMEDMKGQNFLQGGLNVTGFVLASTLPNNYEKIQNGMRKYKKYNQAFVRDAVVLFREAIVKFAIDNQLDTSNTESQQRCRNNDHLVQPKPGHRFMKILRQETSNGRSGFIKFDEYGLRTDFTLNLYETTMTNALAKVGVWNPSKKRRLIPESEPQPVSSEKKETDQISNRTRIVTSIKEEPYLMFKSEYKHMEDKQSSPDGRICGKEKFEGYCVDLAQKVAERCNFKYDICLVQDGNYGSAMDNGTWNGMIGELTKKKADLAVAPITIISTRERVVDFTKPFMSLGISIMIKKPVDSEKSVFSFMDPLSYEIWMCILFAYVGVSVVLFLVSRFSPMEWKVEDTEITNDFTISNSLWYSLGAFMQQGCDISPKAISGRIVGTVWWFFTLIIISSYTANLAAFLTVERMNTPIKSAEDLAKQTKIQYGCYRGGSTETFFQKSKVGIYERMYAYMTSAEGVFTKNNPEGITRVRNSKDYAFLVESSINEYQNMRKPCNTMKVGANLDSKGYGIATPVMSDLRDCLTLAVLYLRESGELEKLKKQWWDQRSECEINKKDDSGQAELTLNNVAGIFYILVGGLTLAVLIASVEFLYKSVVDSKKSKTTFGSMLRCKARLSFRGSLDRDSSGPNTPLRKSTSTYTYTGPTQLQGYDPYPDTNTHTQV